MSLSNIASYIRTYCILFPLSFTSLFPTSPTAVHFTVAVCTVHHHTSHFKHPPSPPQQACMSQKKPVPISPNLPHPIPPQRNSHFAIQRCSGRHNVQTAPLPRRCRRFHWCRLGTAEPMRGMHCPILCGSPLKPAEVRWRISGDYYSGLGTLRTLRTSPTSTHRHRQHLARCLHVHAKAQSHLCTLKADLWCSSTCMLSIAHTYHCITVHTNDDDCSHSPPFTLHPCFVSLSHCLNLIHAPPSKSNPTPF